MRLFSPHLFPQSANVAYEYKTDAQVLTGSWSIHPLLPFSFILIVKANKSIALLVSCSLTSQLVTSYCNSITVINGSHIQEF